MEDRVNSRLYWNEAVETMPREQLRALQWEKLKLQVRYNFEHSPFYRSRLTEAGLHPDNIRNWDDFVKIPVMDKEIHRLVQAESLEKHGNPYALLSCAPRENFVLFAATSGTTGTPTLYTLTRNDRKVLVEVNLRKGWRIGMRPGQSVLHAFSLSMFTGGVPAVMSMSDGGMAVIPVGADAGVRRILQFADLLRPDALCCTPSLAEHLIDRCPDILGYDVGKLGIRFIICGGEPGVGVPSLKERVESAYGGSMFDMIGAAHPFHGVSCPDGVYRGMHLVSEDYCILELLDPNTKRPIPLTEGATGEMVFTWLGWEGSPLMRYSLGDILRVHTDPCPCGMSGLRFHILGRADDMLIVKGVNIYPAALKDAIGRFVPRTTGAMRVVLDSPGPRVNPPLQVELEYGPSVDQSELPLLEHEIVKLCKESLKVSPKLIWNPPGTLERYTHKSKLIVVRT